MGDGNSRGPSTKSGKIVDGRPECEGPSTKTGEIVDGGREFGKPSTKRERNRGWGTVYFTDQEPSPSVQAPSATV